MRRGSVSPRRRLRGATGRFRRIAATLVAGALIASALVALPATVGPAPEPASATFDFSCRSAEGYAYFVNTNSQSVSIVYTGTDTNIRNIPLGGGAPYGTAATPDGSQIYVAGGPTGVSVINSDTLAVTNISHPSFSLPVGAWASPDGTRVFVSNYTSNTVSVISTATNTVTSVINLGGSTASNPGYMDASGNLLFIGRSATPTSPGVVSVIDMTTGALVRTIPQSAGGLETAHSIAVNGAYIATAGQTNVVEIRNQAAPSALARTITVPSGGTSIHGISFVNGTNYLIVGTGSNAVHIYDVVTGALLRTFTPGKESVRTVVVSPILNADGTRDVFLSTTPLNASSDGGLDRITVSGTPANWTYTQNVTALQNFPDGHTPAFSCLQPLEGSKTFASSTISLGEVTRLTITINNDNLVPAAGVTGAATIDNLPSNIRIAPVPNAATTCTNGTATAAAGGSSVSLAGGRVPPATLSGNTKTRGSCTISVDVIGVQSGAMTNTIPAGGLSADVVGRNANPISAAVTVRNPGLRITKAHNDADGQVLAGQTVGYTVTVQNTSTIAQTGIALDDALPAGMTYVPQSTVATQGATVRDNIPGGARADLASGNPVTATLVAPADGFTIPAGGTLTVTYRATVDDPITVSSYTNTATVASTQEPTTVQAQTTLTAAPAALRVQKTNVSPPVSTGNANEYTVTSRVTVTNSGGSTGTYNLADDLSYGAGQAVVNSTVNRVAVSTDPSRTGVLGASPTATDPVQIVNGETILGGRTESWDVTTVFTVNPTAATTANTDCSAADAAGTGTRNIATLTSNGATTTAESCAPVPSMTVDKQPGTVALGANGVADPGDQITWPIVVVNNGSVALTGITVTDPIAAVNCPATTIPIGGSLTCSASKALTQAEITAGSVQNTATADSTQTTPVSDTVVTPIAQSPALSLEKRAGTPVDVNGSGIVDAGDTIAYTFTVTNTGNVPIVGVSVNDPLAGSVTCTQTTLAPGADTDCAATHLYVIRDTDATAGQVVNTARANATAPGSTPVASNEDSTTTDVETPAPALSLEKTAGTPVDENNSGIVDAGDTIQYTFVVTNTGNVPVRAVSVSDPLVGAVTCDDTVIAPGASTDCSANARYTITAGDEVAGTVHNVATSSGTDPDGNAVSSAQDATDTPVQRPAPSLTIDKTAGTPVDVNNSGITDDGDTVVYTFTVTNTGNVPVDDVAVDDPLLAGLAITCDETLLAPGEDTTCISDPYTVTAADETAGVISNSATATGGDPDGGPVRSDPDSTQTPATADDPALNLDKFAADPVDVNQSGITDAGDTIQYTFTVTNTGNVPVREIAISDARAGAVVCDATVLVPTASTECRAAAPYFVTTADETAGVAVNVARADGVDPNDGPVLSNQDSTTTTPIDVPNPSLAIDKIAAAPVDANGSELTDAGDTIQYTFVVTNTGNVPLFEIAITDPKVGAVTCDATTLTPNAHVNCAAAPYTIGDQDQATGSVDNTASATATNPDGGPVVSNEDSTATPVRTPAPRIELTKTAGAPVDVNGSDLTDAGDTVSFTFRAENTGNVRLVDVAVTDPMLGAIVCQSTVLDPGQAMSCTAPAYAIQDGDEGRTVVNTATVTGRNGTTTVTDDDSAQFDVNAPAPELTVEKEADAPTDVNGSGITDAGDTVEYRFRVANTGNVPIDGVVVNDALAGSVTCAPTALAPGETAVCAADAVYEITDADEQTGSVDNTASATGSDPDGVVVTSNEDSTSTPVVTPAPAIALEKSAGVPVDVNGSGITDAGDTIRYTFRVENTGNVPVNLLRVNDPKIGAVSCSPTVLAPEGIASCQADDLYVVDAEDEAAGAVDNTARALAADPDGDTVTSNEDSTSTPVIAPVPSLVLDKSAGVPVDVNRSGITDAGDTIRYTFTVTNTGNVPVSAVAVTDPLVGAVTCTPPSLAVDAVANCTADAVYSITDADEASGAVANTATASASDPDGGTVESNDDSTSTPVLAPAPSLVLDKSAGAPVDVNRSGITDAGDTIQYTFTVTNNGNVPISGVAVTDPLAGAVTCTPTTLAVGSIADCRADAVYTITDADEANRAVNNSATASGADPDRGPVSSNEDSTSTPVVTPAPGLTFHKIAGAPVDVNGSGITDAGDTIQYTFTVTNTGNVPVTSAEVADPLVGAVTCTPTSLAVGAVANCAADAVYRIAAADETAGLIRNRATASAVDPDGGDVPSNEDATLTPVAVPAPSLVLDKSAGAPVDVNGSGITDAGDTIRYTFTVTNNGNVPVSGISVTDPLVGAVTCTPTTLVVGAVADCTADAVYTITETDERDAAVVNSATASGLDPDLGAVTSNEDSTSTPVATPAPAITLDKSAGAPVDVNRSGITDAGDTIQYAFTVRNDGNVPVTAVSVTDPLAGAVTCTPTSLAVGAVANCVADAVYTVTDADEANGAVDNTATAGAVDPDGGAVASNDDSTSTPVVLPTPSLLLDKSAGAPVDVNRSGITDAGDTIQYTFTVTNNGNVPVSAVAVTDPLVGAVTCTPTSLAVDAVANCVADAVYSITDADEASGTVANTAAAGASDPDGTDVLSNQDTTTTPVVTPAPSIALQKSAGVPVDVNRSGITDAGDTIQYTFTVTNNGNVPVSAVRVDDPLVGAVTCTPTSLTVGSTADCSANAVYTITDADETAGVVANTAHAGATDPDGGAVASGEARTSTPVVAPRPSLLLDKIAGAPVDVNGSGITDAGDTIQYTFTVQNTGNVPVSRVSVTDPLAGAVTCTPTTLAVDAVADCAADAPYTITETDETAGLVENRATAGGSDPDDGAVLSNIDSTITSVTVPRPSLVLDKEAETPTDVNGSGITDAGDTIQYTFTVTNNGNVPISGVAVTDPLAGAVTCTPTTLAVRETATCEADAVYTVTETDEAAGRADNRATAAGTDPDAGTVTSNEDTTSTPVVAPVTRLTMQKSARPADANGNGLTDAGDTIQFAFTVTNTGNVPIDELRIGDPLVGAVTCVPIRLSPGATADCTADDPYEVTAADQAAGAVDNTAVARGVDPDEAIVDSNSSSTSTPLIAPAPSISLEKRAGAAVDANRNGRIDAGDSIEYSFVVVNTGNVALTDIAVDDPRLGGDVSCAANSLAAGDRTTCGPVEYTLTQDDLDETRVVNEAAAAGTAPDGATVVRASDSATSSFAVESRLTLDKQATLTDRNGNSKADAGEVLQYVFVVVNTGSTTLHDVAIADAMLTAAGAVVSCPADPLAPGDEVRCTASYTLTAQDAARGEIRNTATATADGVNGPVVSDPDSVRVLVDSPPLPATGGTVAVWVVALGVMLLIAGAAVLIVRRRRSKP